MTAVKQECTVYFNLYFIIALFSNWLYIILLLSLYVFLSY
jgi:hypothetical protein